MPVAVVPVLMTLLRWWEPGRQQNRVGGRCAVPIQTGYVPGPPT
jgi:hypothetical protein